MDSAHSIKRRRRVHVSLERGTWHCFGCGLGGDGFSFIEKVEGVDFKGALKILAEKAGVLSNILEILSAKTNEKKTGCVN